MGGGGQKGPIVRGKHNFLFKLGRNLKKGAQLVLRSPNSGGATS